MLHITPWERTALQLLATGKGNEEIANRLRIGAHRLHDASAFASSFSMS